MNLQEYCSYDGLGLAELVRKKEIKPSEVCSLALEAIDKVNPTINAVIQSYPERAEKADETVDINAPFAGVPIFLKDLLGEKGCLQESGSRIFKGRRATEDPWIVKLFREAGTVIMGRCTTPEFGGGGSTESILYGKTRNPWNLEHTAGGSSGGSGALVAAGITPVTHASDGGGSTRYPACCNSLVGMKPSRALVSLAPNESDVAAPNPSEFVISRTVRDTAGMLDALNKPAPGEATPFYHPEKPFLEQMAAPGPRLKIALSMDGWAPDVPETDIAVLIRKVGAKLEDLGHTVIEIEKPPVDVYEGHDYYLRGTMGRVSLMIERVSKALNKPISLDTFEAVILKYYEEGKNYTLEDHLAYRAATNKFARDFGNFFLDYDIMLAPVTGVRLPKLGEQSLSRTDIGGSEFLWEGYYHSPYQALNNMTGIPGISIPAGLDTENLPVGAQLIGPIGSDGVLLNVAAELEEAMPWRDLHPPVFAGNP